MGIVFAVNSTYGSFDDNVVWNRTRNVSLNMMECPDLFRLGSGENSWVLLGSMAHSGGPNQWWTGSLSGDPPRYGNGFRGLFLQAKHKPRGDFFNDTPSKWILGTPYGCCIMISPASMALLAGSSHRTWASWTLATATQPRAAVRVCKPAIRAVLSLALPAGLIRPHRNVVYRADNRSMVHIMRITSPSLAAAASWFSRENSP